MSIFDVKKNLILPEEMTPELAEFLGILTGNGNYHKSHALYLSGYKNLEKWIQMKGFSNSRHINKIMGREGV